MAESVTVRDILEALDWITGGRVVKGPGDLGGQNPFVLTKSSGIPGKSVTETPGLVWGDPSARVRRAAVLMTLTESAIELAAATGVECLVAHHPIADGANSGGVTLKNYLGLYGLHALELHEAFHGLHPGIPWLHGHRALEVDIRAGGIHGNILYYGEALPEVRTLGNLLDRLESLMDLKTEREALEQERRLRNCPDLLETCVSTRGHILLGTPESPVRRLLHIFPHTGFTPEHLEAAKAAHPDADTVLATISRVYPGNPLIDKARELGMNFLCGNSHALEILENGIPLARALATRLPGLEVRVFRERVTSYPLDEVGSGTIRDYGRDMASRYLPGTR
ncbi:hypothetical protein Apau_2253 [Aminomonas paucivorans DSM 12260]|uniref:NGG1p interacting factor 3 protein, NIF3 n=1 Tax=Aminomonas paucivorans DSM 12260 TaxID=584708 RepID=E3CZN0_9BACT|nr:Nif3-like dinuclear metal center hexameric protein [Aminomonas paucivorans]EFQ24662.1 hypothetical protein Apau_2253 [Aminomonas paucivorans DSM 12260]